MKKPVRPVAPTVPKANEYYNQFYPNKRMSYGGRYTKHYSNFVKNFHKRKVYRDYRNDKAIYDRQMADYEQQMSAYEQDRQLRIEQRLLASRKAEAKKLSQDMMRNYILANQFIESPVKFALSKAKEYVSEDIEKKGGKVSKADAAKLAGIKITEEVLNIAQKGAEFAFDRYCTLQEDYITNQAVNNVMGTINRAKSGIGSAISGAVSLSAAGPAGAVAGAVIGLASFGVNQYIDYQKRMSSYYQQLNATNFQTQFDAARLGLSGSSGTEN